MDIFIIGGGINGTALAADAAGRGLSVTLCEKNDLASGTSSTSTKLIHGGLRYLEQYDFKLVRHALIEREILLQRAPNLITPLEFILPYESHLRPAWLLRVGLFLYDHLAKRKFLPASKAVSLRTDVRGISLQAHLRKGFSYYDCFTDDARLVVLNALLAKEKGATILTRTEFISAVREDHSWKIIVKNTLTQEITTYYAKALINVSGPWIKKTHENISPSEVNFEIEWVKGSHIIVPKLYSGNFAYILQNKDNRIVFAIPYEKKFTLIGTTDIELNTTENNLENLKITPEEEIYLCDIINQYFQHKLNPKHIIASWAGVRCLQKSNAPNPKDISRGYKFILTEKNQLPLLTVIGGKLTTHRVLAEQALEKLKPFFPSMPLPWTAQSALPGCNFTENFKKFTTEFHQQFPWLPKSLAHRYTRNYGKNAYRIVKNANKLADLGIAFSADLYENEVRYLIEEEWAKTAEDILWRRTKLGLIFIPKEQQALETWLKEI